MVLGGPPPHLRHHEGLGEVGQQHLLTGHPLWHLGFFDDEDFRGTSMGTPGPGTCADVTKHSLKNNGISSVRLAKPAGGSAW